MVKLEDLTGIPPKRRNAYVQILDNLLWANVISGYNWYAKSCKTTRVVTLSHIHESEAYKAALLLDLESMGYDPQRLIRQFRDKGSAFKWDLDFIIRDSSGALLPGLSVKVKKTGAPVNLGSYLRTLKEGPKLEDEALIGIDYGWQLDIPFHSQQELLGLADLLLYKGSKNLVDPGGEPVIETDQQRRERSAWPGAYETPVIILGAEAINYAPNHPNFDRATQIAYEENENEISFIIGNKLPMLVNSANYGKLISFGVTRHECLANKRFLSFMNRS